MCGIAGILNLDGQAADAEDVRAVTRALAHRGPDGEGVYTDGQIGLGHRRLAILDLSDSGSQPMRSADGRYVVSFNGEIFNFVELRRELEAHGHRFLGESDTEVIANAYDQWGADCVLHFNGMWAFALWDRERRELFLSRDRFGIKPLFFLREPNRLVFASELKSFLRLRGFTPRENEDALRRALHDPGSVEMVGETLLQGVERLAAGHNMLVSSAGSRVWRWWRTLDHLPSIAPTFGEQTEAFRELFFDACRLRLRSDVPVATCLSGGLDSSSILCTLAVLHGQASGGIGTERETFDSQRAFVATFPGTSQDEEHYARLAIEHTKAVPRYCPMESETAIQELYEFAYAFENVGASLMMPLWRIYRELRRDGVVVSLDGHGGDELLGGYPWFVDKALAETSLVRHPRRAIDLIRTFPSVGRRKHSKLLVRQVPGYPAYRWVRDRGRGQRSSRPLRGWAGLGLDEDRDAHVDADDRAALDLLGPANGEMYREFHHTRLPHILRNFDRCSMAHGVEIRMPFMDWRVVCFAFALPWESKIGGGFTKRILREAMRGLMPEAVRTRKHKIGFSPPMAEWFNAGLGDWVRDQVRTPPFLDSNVWDGPAIRDFVLQRQGTSDWTEPESDLVWRFLQAHLWRETFFNSVPA